MDGGLIPSFGGFLWTVGAFVIALSIIVAIHEYGHYIIARLCGIRSEVFSVGFGPVIWSRMDKHGTRWQIAALPLGGYVKFLGDVSAASDRPDEKVLASMDEDTRRQTIHGAPLWARAATVAAGPVFNFILSTLVFAAILFARGTASEPLTIDRVLPMPGVVELEPGDELLAIAGIDIPPLGEFDNLVDTLPEAGSLTYTVRRGESELDVTGPYPYPALVSAVSLESAAIDADLREGDVITAVDGVQVATFGQLREIVGNSDGRGLRLDVWRDGEMIEKTLTPRRMDIPDPEGGFETRWLIGISGGLMFEPATELPGPIEALKFGVDQIIFIIQSSISGLYHMAVGAISSCNLQGPIGIAETSGAAASQGWVSFFWFIAVLSTAVGFLNLFPIPVLDGGHLVFHAYEALAGKPPSDAVLRVMMGIGLILLVALMSFAVSNDIFCP
ncbi:MAG: RIP metalloprotease RseP [Rhodobacteraceae bacterium]|nr:RIP metalloprotease RseP [Paracoccaceae bacterium]